MSVAVLDTTEVTYRVVTTENGVEKGVIFYGLEGDDGVRKTVIPVLSCDRERIVSLVDDLNKAQLDLNKLNELP